MKRRTSNRYSLDCKFTIETVGKGKESWRIPTRCKKHGRTCNAKFIDDIWTCE